MIHPISATTCTQAWTQAITFLGGEKQRCAYNVILDIGNPIAFGPADRQIVQALDEMLTSHEAQPVVTVAGTLFPAGHYRQRGRNGVMEDFPKRAYPKLKTNWGTYAGRMLDRVDHHGKSLNPLEIIIEKLKYQTQRASPKRAIYEVSMVDIFADLPIYDPGHDARRVMNQPCLAHLSFKLTPDRGLMLTALYRNHYYIERALGNLIGLSHLLFFVAKESGLTARSLVCHSTFARLDFDGGWTVNEVNRLIRTCQSLSNTNQLVQGRTDESVAADTATGGACNE
jgi:hypothetical protein